MGCESQLIDVVDPHLPIYWLSLSKRRAILVLVVLECNTCTGGTSAILVLVVLECNTCTGGTGVQY